MRSGYYFYISNARQVGSLSQHQLLLVEVNTFCESRRYNGLFVVINIFISGLFCLLLNSPNNVLCPSINVQRNFCGRPYFHHFLVNFRFNGMHPTEKIMFERVQHFKQILDPFICHRSYLELTNQLKLFTTLFHSPLDLMVKLFFVTFYFAITTSYVRKLKYELRSLFLQDQLKTLKL